MIPNYVAETDRLIFRHHVSKNIPCDTYSMHTHNTYELIYFLDGDATHVIEDRKYKLKKGDLILIRPFHYHFIQIDSQADYERYDILFDAEKHGVEGLSLLPESMEVISLAGNTIAQDIFQKCDLYHKKCDTPTFERLLSHLLSELFYNISLFPQSQSEEVSTVSPLVSEVLRYINENLSEPISMQEIAGRLFVSESYLFRLFKRELHQTPKRYVMEKRLLMAQKMLSTGGRPTEICETCGFGDYSSFYRSYTAFFGHAPSEETGEGG